MKTAMTTQQVHAASAPQPTSHCCCHSSDPVCVLQVPLASSFADPQCFDRHSAHNECEHAQGRTPVFAEEQTLLSIASDRYSAFRLTAIPTAHLLTAPNGPAAAAGGHEQHGAGWHDAAQHDARPFHARPNGRSHGRPNAAGLQPGELTDRPPRLNNLHAAQRASLSAGQAMNKQHLGADLFVESCSISHASCRHLTAHAAVVPWTRPRIMLSGMQSVKMALDVCADDGTGYGTHGRRSNGPHAARRRRRRPQRILQNPHLPCVRVGRCASLEKYPMPPVREDLSMVVRGGLPADSSV